jgi:hypothetical protein
MGCKHSKHKKNRSVIEMISIKHVSMVGLDIHELILLQKSNNYNTMSSYWFNNNSADKIDLNSYKATIHLLGI